MTELEEDPDRVRDALEARLVQEEVEAAAEQLHRNTRSLSELLLDWSDAGYRVCVHVGRHSWTGAVLAAAGADDGLVVLDTGSSRVEITLAAVSAAEQAGYEPARPAPQADPWTPSTLVARLRWHLTQDPPLEVRVGNDTVDLHGVVVAVAPTHVELHTSDRIVALVPSFAEIRSQ